MRAEIGCPKPDDGLPFSRSPSLQDSVQVEAENCHQQVFDFGAALHDRELQELARDDRQAAHAQMAALPLRAEAVWALMRRARPAVEEPRLVLLL